MNRKMKEDTIQNESAVSTAATGDQIAVHRQYCQVSRFQITNFLWHAAIEIISIKARDF